MSLFDHSRVEIMINELRKEIEELKDRNKLLEEENKQLKERIMNHEDTKH